jgi:membrane peptidoglycan carboxypeptidase
MTGFEPAALWPPARCATKLRYIPVHTGNPACGKSLAHLRHHRETSTATTPELVGATTARPGQKRGAVGAGYPGRGWSPRPVSIDAMGNTRPLPQPEAPSGEPAPRRASAARPRSRARRYLKRAAITLLVLILIAVVGVGILWIATPSASEASQLARAQAAEHGIAYPGPPVPENFTRPLIATEDKRFYTEPGVDVLAVGRVAWAEASNGSDQGGATIEQQLAKMLYTPTETGFTAELKQVVLAFKLNATYSKAQILALYAEVAYYGHGYYGLEQASCGYFGHPATDLTVPQGAMLAGVVNAPSLDDPIDDPLSARQRLEHVITRMVAVGDLTAPQARAALAAPLGIVPRDEAHC